MHSMRSGQEDAFRIQPETGAVIFEYPRASPGLGLSYFEVSGRRPSAEGNAYREYACTFSLFVLEGTGTMTVEGTEYALAPHVLVTVLPGNRWSLTGDVKYIVATTPGFYPDQVEEVPEK
jgi:mannose-6-phosphate isomerase-like protein (cupin superfamily)